jgi:hypothetical protein
MKNAEFRRVCYYTLGLSEAKVTPKELGLAVPLWYKSLYLSPINPQFAKLSAV